MDNISVNIGEINCFYLCVAVLKKLFKMVPLMISVNLF